jgi:hypothetical protein
MKAKELIEILKQNPEAEVVHYEYTGSCTPLLGITEVELVLSGDRTAMAPYEDESKYLDDDFNAVEDIFILKNT